MVHLLTISIFLSVVTPAYFSNELVFNSTFSSIFLFISLQNSVTETVQKKNGHDVSSDDVWATDRADGEDHEFPMSCSSTIAGERFNLGMVCCQFSCNYSLIALLMDSCISRLIRISHSK